MAPTPDNYSLTGSFNWNGVPVVGTGAEGTGPVVTGAEGIAPAVTAAAGAGPAATGPADAASLGACQCPFLNWNAVPNLTLYVSIGAVGVVLLVSIIIGTIMYRRTRAPEPESEADDYM